MDVLLQANFSERGFGLRPKLNAAPVCDAQRRWDGIYGIRRNVGAEAFLSSCTNVSVIGMCVCNNVTVTTFSDCVC